MRKNWKRWRLSPPVVVLVTAFCVVAFVILSSFVSARQNRINVRVEIADPLIEASAPQSETIPPSLVLPDGEMERTAARVREVSALALGLTLLSVNEAIARRPAMNVAALVDRFAANGLLPPGVKKHTATGVLESDRAVIYARYRFEPLAVEIVSIGRESKDGPPIIGRIATGVDEDSSASLFIARQASGASIPEPFAPVTQVAAMNWSIEPLRERTFTPQELEQINGWLHSQGGGK
ncbi:MAG: hypothetical protein AB7U82_34045 [Blastocatellales bacterium]